MTEIAMMKICTENVFSNFEKDNGKKLAIIHLHELDLNALQALKVEEVIMGVLLVS